MARPSLHRLAWTAVVLGLVSLPVAGSAGPMWQPPEIKPPNDTCRQYAEAAINQSKEALNRYDLAGDAGFPNRLEDVCRIMKFAKHDLDRLPGCQGSAPYQMFISEFDGAKSGAADIYRKSGRRIYCEN